MATAPSVTQVEQATARDEGIAPENVGAIGFRVDGKVHVLRHTMRNHRDELDLWKQSSLTVDDMVGVMSDGQLPIFVLAGFIFLAQRQQGVRTTYDTELDALAGDNHELELLTSDELAELEETGDVAPPHPAPR
jgi:hypothetical protein